MAKKFLIQKVITLSLVVVMVICTSITSLAAPQTIETLAASNSTIAISQTVGVQDQQAQDSQLFNLHLETPTTASTKLESSTTASNKDIVTNKLDELFGTRTVGSDKSGILYKVYGSADKNVMGGPTGPGAVDSPNASFFGAIKNPELATLFNKPETQASLKEIAKSAFSDITGSKYYDGYIPIMVSKGVIAGTGSGKFEGDAPITMAQLGVILYNTGAVGSSDADAWSVKQVTDDGCPSWAINGFANMLGNILDVTGINGKNPQIYNENASRGMIAYTVANTLWPKDIKKGGKYYEQAKAMQNVYFSDVKKVMTEAQIEAKNSNDTVRAYYDAFQGKYASEGVPIDILAAMLCLHDKGIMNGDTNKNSLWTQSVTRGDTCMLVTKAIQAYGAEIQ